jgi:Uma2 family endonuclease
VVELREAKLSRRESKTDSLKKLQEKMQEYIDNGARLGWLIDRENRRVEIYRPGQDVEIIQNPATLSGENVLPGFVLDLAEII